MNIMISLTKFLYAIPRSKSVIPLSFSSASARSYAAIRQKRPELSEQIENVIFHQDNTPAHTAAKKQLEIGLLGFDEITHPPSLKEITSQTD